MFKLLQPIVQIWRSGDLSIIIDDLFFSIVLSLKILHKNIKNSLKWIFFSILYFNMLSFFLWLFGKISISPQPLLLLKTISSNIILGRGFLHSTTQHRNYEKGFYGIYKIIRIIFPWIKAFIETRKCHLLFHFLFIEPSPLPPPLIFSIGKMKEGILLLALA